MAIVNIPADAQQQDDVPCALCGSAVPLARAMVGPIDKKAGQLFACDSHFVSSAQYMLGWIDFARQRRQDAQHRLFTAPSRSFIKQPHGLLIH